MDRVSKKKKRFYATYNSIIIRELNIIHCVIIVV